MYEYLSIGDLTIWRFDVWIYSYLSIYLSIWWLQDRAGVSKGYGFVTFETEEEARRLQVKDKK